MKLVLVRGGCPPVAVRPEDRSRYLAALEAASVDGNRDDYEKLMRERLIATLEAYLAALDGA